jgi:predicted DNA-binding transcriptional regulator AlpA
MDERAERLLTVEQLAEWLQKPVSWIYRHTTESCPPEKRLPSVRLDRGLRFQRHAIQRWIDAHSARESGGLGEYENACSGAGTGSTGVKSPLGGAKTHRQNGHENTFS